MDQLLQFKRSLLLLLFTGFSLSLFAQTITGTVTDKQNGDPLIGATVTIKNNSGNKRSTGVGLDGSFTFRNLQAGTYEVEAKYISYSDEEAKVEVNDGRITTVNLKLKSKSKNLNEVLVSGKTDGGTDQSAINVVKQLP